MSCRSQSISTVKTEPVFTRHTSTSSFYVHLHTWCRIGVLRGGGLQFLRHHGCICKTTKMPQDDSGNVVRRVSYFCSKSSIGTSLYYNVMGVLKQRVP